MEYRLEVIDGLMRPIFDGMESELNELMWELLLPFTMSAAAMLGEIKRVEGEGLYEWGFESPETRITCTPETLTLEDKRERDGGPLRMELPFKEAVLLLERWLFECAWREQQRREQIAGGHARR
jgi:hypothetical protein